MVRIWDKCTLIIHKYTSPFNVAFVLLLPNLIWISLDRSLWKGDPAGYAVNSVSLYRQLVFTPHTWLNYMFGGYKAPLMFWIGQFFVGFGNVIGSINFSLLLIPLIASFISIILLFRSFEWWFKSKSIAVLGCFMVVASPLFNGLSTGFWIEPMQVAIISWFIYALLKANTWSFYFSLAQFVIAVSLAMLTKVSSPMYIVGPALAFWAIAFRSVLFVKPTPGEILFLFISLLFFIPTAVFYVHNLHDLLGFAHFAATSPLFASDASRTELWLQAVKNGIFLPGTYYWVILLVIIGLIKTIKKKAYSNFGLIFLVALFQLFVFFIAWVSSSNIDPRYFLPALPYFVLLACWALSLVNNKIVAAISAGVIFVQFVLINGFAFGQVQLERSYGMIHPLTQQPDRNLNIIRQIIPLATRDYSVILDLNPEIGAEFQYEQTKQNLTQNCNSYCVDVSAFFSFNRQEIDTGKIDIEVAWEKILARNPDYYITWSSRLSSAETEMKRIDRYCAVTVPMRWGIAKRIRNCNLYKVIPFKDYPDLLIYKRVNISDRKL